MATSWDEALVECELYGGWLVNIGGVREQNCLLEFGHSKAELVDKWYWTGDWGYVWMEIIGSIEGATDKNSANV